MSSQGPSVGPSMQPKFEKSIQNAIEEFQHHYDNAEDDKGITCSVLLVWASVQVAISMAGTPILKERCKDWDGFQKIIKSASKKERELIDLLLRIAKKEVPWLKAMHHFRISSSRLEELIRKWCISFVPSVGIWKPRSGQEWTGWPSGKAP